MTDENRTEAGEQGAGRAEGAGGTDITGGADKTGRGGLADGSAPSKVETGVRESGDLAGATSTHAGAGGAMENTGGTGTAPTE